MCLVVFEFLWAPLPLPESALIMYCVETMHGFVSDLLNPILYCLVDWLVFCAAVSSVIVFFGLSFLVALVLAAIVFDGAFWLLFRLSRLLVH